FRNLFHRAPALCRIGANSNNGQVWSVDAPLSLRRTRAHDLRKRWFYAAWGPSLTRGCNQGGSEIHLEKISNSGVVVAILTSRDAQLLALYGCARLRRHCRQRSELEPRRRHRTVRLRHLRREDLG